MKREIEKIFISETFFNFEVAKWRKNSKTAASVFEKIGLTVAFGIGIALTIFSLYSLVIDISVRFDLKSVLVDIIFLLLGVLICYSCIKTYRKAIYYGKLVESAFEEGIYRRLEPLLRKFAEVHVQMEELEARLNGIDKKVDAVMEGQVKASANPATVEGIIAPGTSISFAVKSIFLAIITMSGFVFMIETMIPHAHYAILLFFILWWLLITSEFELFNKAEAWLFVFLPIIIVPTGFILTHAALRVAMPVGSAENVTVCIFFLALVIYAFAYYSWAVLRTKGTLPFIMRFRRM